MEERVKHEGHNVPVSIHWQVSKIPIIPNITILGRLLFKIKTPETGLKLVALVLMVGNKKISKDCTRYAHVKLLTPGDEYDSTQVLQCTHSW